MRNQNTLNVIESDDYLRPVEDIINRRHNKYISELDSFNSVGGIIDYANGYNYFGFHYDNTSKGWRFREWLPLAKHVFIYGDFNDWDKLSIPLERDKNGIWEVFLSDEIYKDRIVNGTLYKLFIHGDNGWNERIDAYTRRAIEDKSTHDFTACISNDIFDWGDDNRIKRAKKQPLIYECHIGMSGEEQKVTTFNEFTENTLTRIKNLGYNTIQIMAIAEHPYYGSFGYHVANFFAVSSRFGSINDFKNLIKTSHSMGLNVIIDLVHSHFIKNINEGLNELDGSTSQYCKDGEEGYNKHWDSKNFDYSKSEVRHFLLSNAKYWIEEFHIDGFRFDGVTAMLYKNHGYQKFTKREDYFNENVNEDALLYLTLCNKLIHSLNPNAITIAEDVSGMPTLCSKTEDGGVGFDYRLAMSTPDYLIELLEQRDEDWDLYKLWEQLNNRTINTKTISYSESHDQALVGDKTLSFRLMDKQMYFKMDKSCNDIIIERGIALHKMIRLITISTAANGYLNFMGNEFGHPDWIDFPREGNNWSYQYATRKWSLVDNGFLRYGQLNLFDKKMISLVKKHKLLDGSYGYLHKIDTENQSIIFSRGNLLFSFNFHPNKSIPAYKTEVSAPGKYRIILNSDAIEFSGFGRNDDSSDYFTEEIDGKTIITYYNTSRSAIVFQKME